MTRWRFVVQDNAHRTVRAKVVHVRLRLIRLVPCLGKEQQWITKVTAIGRVIHCPYEMSRGVDSKIDFHFNCDSRLHKCYLVGRYCDSQSVIGTGFTGIVVGLGSKPRICGCIGFLVIHCGKGIRLACWLRALPTRKGRAHPKDVCCIAACLDNYVGTLANLRA